MKTEMVNLDEYRFDKIDALSQFHIVRRLSPIVGELAAVVANSAVLKQGKKLEEMGIDDIDFDKVAKHIGPVLSAMAKLPDEDMNYAIFGLLKGVSRKQTAGGGWARVTTDNGQFMFEDIKGNLVLMMTLAGKSFAANLGGFINALPSGLKEGALQSQQIG
jgi:hypothetical protein